MIELFTIINEWVVATGVPWWALLAAGVIVSLLLMAGIEVFLGMVAFCFCFFYLPIVVMTDTGHWFGAILGLLIGVLVWMFCLVLGDKVSDNKRRYER